MSTARAKGTSWEVELLPQLRALFGDQVERAPLKGVNDHGDFTGTPYLVEAKNTEVPHFVEWARTARKKARDKSRWVILWSGGDRRKATSIGPSALVPLSFFRELIAAHGLKPCSSCLEVKPLSGFNRQAKGPDGLQHECVRCLKSRSLTRKFGLDIAEYERLVAAQGGVCALCGKTCSTGRQLAADHCHAGGHVRGLLCSKCNTGLGMFDDDPVLLSKAAAYLAGANQLDTVVDL